MHDKNYQIACDLSVHECDGKIMMYNFNIRRYIAQQKKKKKKKETNEYRMCKRKENKQQRHRQEKIFLFTLVNENTQDLQIEHTVISGRIKSRINYALFQCYFYSSMCVCAKSNDDLVHPYFQKKRRISS